MKTLLLLPLLVANSLASSSSFLLGADYSELIPPSLTALATDSSGAIYLASTRFEDGLVLSRVAKLSADGRTHLWENDLDFSVSFGLMAVDAEGGVYVAGYTNGFQAVFIAKLSATGTGLAWRTQVSSDGLLGISSLTVDSQGRAYLAGGSDSVTGKVLRLNATGSAIDYMAELKGPVTSVAVDASGAALVAGNLQRDAFVARLEPDGTAGYYRSLAAGSRAGTVAVDPNGNAVVLSRRVDGSLVLQRMDAAGGVVLSRIVQAATPTQGAGDGHLVLDGAGNAYVTRSSYIYNSGFSYSLPARNSLGTCGGAINAAVDLGGTRSFYGGIAFISGIIIGDFSGAQSRQQGSFPQPIEEENGISTGLIPCRTCAAHFSNLAGSFVLGATRSKYSATLLRRPASIRTRARFNS